MMANQLTFIPDEDPTEELDGECAFCGSRNLQVKPVWKKYWFVACNDCRAAGPMGKTVEDAIRLFKHRHIPTEENHG